jgi:AcrR family transcriptional regulator
MAERGDRATSLTDVARRAGVSRATAYRAFGDKEGLVRAIVLGEIARFVAAGEREVLFDAPAPEVVTAAVRFALRYLREHAALQHVLRHEPEQLVDVLVERPEHPSLVGAMTAIAAERLAAAGHAGAFSVDVHAAAEHMVRAVFSHLLVPTSALDDARVAGLVARAVT